jgi:hypothetical protein
VSALLIACSSILCTFCTSVVCLLILLVPASADEYFALNYNSGVERDGAYS